MSTRTAVSPVHAAMVESAVLTLVVDTPVPVLLVIKVLTASMTQMNVPTRPLSVRMKAGVSILTAPTSENRVFNSKFQKVPPSTRKAHLNAIIISA